MFHCIPDVTICFVVKTHYKSGLKRTEYIFSTNEEDMWKTYNSRHKRGQNLIKNKEIYDSYYPIRSK